MVQPIQLKTHDSYQELQEQQEQINESWTLRTLAKYILDDPAITRTIEDELTLISLAHQEYKEQYLERSENINTSENEETYLNFQEFYQNLKDNITQDKDSQIDQINKINQIRDIIILGEMDYEIKNSSLYAHIKDPDGETQIKYEGPSKPTQIGNKK